jgi:opacity protein-like surface antigen
MRRALLVLGLMAFIISLAGPAAAAPIETKAGTKALVFQFSGLSDLGLSGYQGGIGARYYFQDGMALRPGLDIGISSSKDKTEDPEVKDTGTLFGLSLAVEKHLAGAKSISPYLGAGVGFHYGQDKTEQGDFSETDKATTISVAGLAGFEWGFTESLSLGGEYSLGFATGSHKTERKSNNTTVTTVDESGSVIGVGTASVFLSVNW